MLTNMENVFTDYGERQLNEPNNPMYDGELDDSKDSRGKAKKAKNAQMIILKLTDDEMRSARRKAPIFNNEDESILKNDLSALKKRLAVYTILGAIATVGIMAMPIILLPYIPH